MITPVPFAVEHLTRLAIQPAQCASIHLLIPEHAARLVGPWSWTGMVEGVPLVCGGILANEFGAGVLWAFLAPGAGPHMLRITRFVRRMVVLAGLRRLQATALASFPEGCRWLELLGFEREGRLRRYGPDGADHFLYARVGP